MTEWRTKGEKRPMGWVVSLNGDVADGFDFAVGLEGAIRAYVGNQYCKGVIDNPVLVVTPIEEAETPLAENHLKSVE